MFIVQKIVNDLLQTWSNFQHTFYDAFNRDSRLIFTTLFFISFGLPFIDSFSCLREIHKLRLRLQSNTTVLYYAIARTKLILIACLLYSISFFLTYPNMAHNPTNPNPEYIYAIGIIITFIANISYRRSGLFISTYYVAAFFTMQLEHTFKPFLSENGLFTILSAYIIIVLMSFAFFPADITAFSMFGTYSMHGIK